MGKARRTRDTILPVGIIYKISSADGTLVYYGATDNFVKRMRDHKSSYKRYLNSNGQYYTYCDILELPNYKTEIFQTHNNITWGALLDVETDIIFNNDCVNKISKSNIKNNPNYISPCEINNPEYRKEQNDKYRNENAAKINEQFICCDCPGRYTYSSKSKHFKTQIHIKALKLKLEQQQKQIDEMNKDIQKLKDEPKKKIIIKLKNSNNTTINNN